jgi:hypothetical protein
MDVHAAYRTFPDRVRWPVVTERTRFVFPPFLFRRASQLGARMGTPPGDMPNQNQGPEQ